MWVATLGARHVPLKPACPSAGKPARRGGCGPCSRRRTMIRPWYRSRLFWLGLPGLVFMGWLWLAKADQSFFFSHTAITGPTESTTRSIGAKDGSIYQRTSWNSYGVGGRVGFHWRGFHGSGRSTYFPRRPFGIVRVTTYHVGHDREIALAWWVVVSAYTAAWLGAVAGWQRRKARLSRRAAAELPGS